MIGLGLVLVALATSVITAVLLVFPALLALRAAVRPRPVHTDAHTPSVSVVLAARDETAVIDERLRNLLAQDYPAGLVEVIVACDGSPETAQAARGIRSDRVTVLDLPHVGKAAALNSAIRRASHQVLAFTDANTAWEHGALRALVAPFADPAVGGVAGDQRYLPTGTTDPVTDGERVHWDLDRWLKRMESRGGSVTSSTGAIHALRRELVDEVPPDVTDDFFLSTGVVAAGRRLVFAPEARAWEPVAPDRDAEFARKVRIMTRGLRGVIRRRDLLDPRRTGFYALQLACHKVGRRLLFVPLAVLLVGTALASPAHPVLLGLTVVQATGYSAGLVGLALPRRVRPLRVPAYLCLGLAAAATATFRVLRGQRVDRWDPRRAAVDHAVTGPER